ncbi:MAG TPA: hypothetical protein VK627_10815 [Edaphobacter sp.]|nr:hypothetical protein [Edaphobacter sp.]
MIRQAINCDMCGAEKQAVTSHWFVAYEQGGELKLRGWESPKNSRKNVKHLCGQKCVQRLTANFTASVMAPGHVSESSVVKDVVPEVMSQHDGGASDRDDMPILERMGYDRETAASIEAESWAGPAKPKENAWGAGAKPKVERGGFINSTRLKPQTGTRIQQMA